MQTKKTNLEYLFYLLPHYQHTTIPRCPLLTYRAMVIFLFENDEVGATLERDDILAENVPEVLPLMPTRIDRGRSLTH